MGVNDIEKSVEASRKASSIYHQLGDLKGDATVLDLSVEAEMQGGDLAEVIDLADQQRDIYLELDDKDGECAAACVIAKAYAAMQQYEIAQDRMKEVIQLSNTTGNKAVEAQSLIVNADILART